MLNTTFSGEDDLLQLKVEITTLGCNTSATIRAMVALTAKRLGGGVVEDFWRDLMRDARARGRLGDEIDAGQFRAALSQWLVELFPREPVDPALFLLRQSEVGALHARMQIPMWLSLHVTRALKRGICGNLQHTRLSQDEFVQAILYVSGVLDVASAAIAIAHIGGLERALRAEEALREVSIDDDFRAEREKQKASLAEWAQGVFLEAHRADGGDGMLPLSRSEFGLWFFHRAQLLFGRSSEYAAIAGLVEEADAHVRQLGDGEDGPGRHGHLREIRQITGQINNLLSLQFSHAFDIGNARDPLSRLLNRRFLRAAISREVALRRRTGRAFSVIMLEISQFRALRERLGETGADTLVQQTAAMLLNAVRSSDSVFSMGRETFLILRVGADAQEATAFARGIVERYAATHFSIDGQTLLENTLNVGVIEYDGHPDPRRLVDQVADALRRETGSG
ncbi:GGDEF domain-containing protein [Bosea sp. (in: a-proteobacteria)]|uniref:GGDEF domain-containing protein n=1 Tax=Bosea sp. (in: a-proteobacteria) TaxID=1871050 RepID=UPI0026239BB2|nr:GGDEF domain-containing protein [Bosea sp. (in: a-proteobacteria)]MCO5090402.1 GGDEF domain-containing protein [Bosea sp. (in: a-proteobacteria)]